MAMLRFVDAIELIPRAAWNALAPDGNPFVRHEFLAALESSGSLRRELGWRAHHATLWRDGALAAAAPCYLKANSHGEFVFDHAWADAHERFGLDYFPKLLVAVPYSPVPGPRLLARDADDRAALARGLVEEAKRLDLSSVHVNFAAEADARALDAGGDAWLAREDVQFHWPNRGYAGFDDFLAALTSKRRKEARRERAPFARPGWQFEWLDGAALDDDAIAFVHACYVRTFDDKGNYPALSRAFFATLGRTLPGAVRVLVAREHGERVAMAYCMEGGGALYGRYWGAVRHVPGLHFEACYYRGIEYAIARGLSRFEPGAQGEHKLARGFLPVATRSRHWIANPVLREAIERSLARESAWYAQYHRSLAAHTPYAER
jgi:hypothetical protein